MSKSITLNEALPFIEDVLASGGSISFAPKGKSMLPLIEEGKDSVVLSPLKHKPKKYDLVLYRRGNGQFVLHRIVKAKNGFFVMCGDNQTDYEFDISENDVIGTVTAIVHNGKKIESTNIRYKLFLKHLYFKRTVKRIFIKTKSIIKKRLTN